eukprot:11555681-Ditylum_brightwellii.AAC.1
MFATQIGAASTLGQCVINAGYQKEYKSVKQIFVSVEYPGDGKAVYTWIHPNGSDHHKWHSRSMSSKVILEKKLHQRYTIDFRRAIRFEVEVKDVIGAFGTL